MQRESNARLVQWSDGTTQLQIGSEFFDVDAAEMGEGRDFAMAREVGRAAGAAREAPALTRTRALALAGVRDRWAE